jgi:hypothetical protein
MSTVNAILNSRTSMKWFFSSSGILSFIFSILRITGRSEDLDAFSGIEVHQHNLALVQDHASKVLLAVNPKISPPFKRAYNYYSTLKNAICQINKTAASEDAAGRKC